MELANFIYASFVGMLNQGLAVQDALFARAMENLIRAGQELAARSLPKPSLNDVKPEIRGLQRAS
ncbi:hypothetical protein ACVIIW_002648 [Bradyrhizobium sp. USDA 4449]